MTDDYDPHDIKWQGQEEMTDEEFADYDMDATLALSFIREEVEDRRGVKGSIRCPRCEGKLNYEVAKNGHIRGKCEKKECLEFIQ